MFFTNYGDPLNVPQRVSDIRGRPDPPPEPKKKSPPRLTWFMYLALAMTTGWDVEAAEEYFEYWLSESKKHRMASVSGASGYYRGRYLVLSTSTPPPAVVIHPIDTTPSGDGGTSSATSLSPSTSNLRRSTRFQDANSAQHTPSHAHGSGISVAADTPNSLAPAANTPFPPAAHTLSSSPSSTVPSRAKRPHEDDGGDDDMPQRPVRRRKLTQAAAQAKEEAIEKAEAKAIKANKPCTSKPRTRRKKVPQPPPAGPSSPSPTAPPQVAANPKSSRKRRWDADEVHSEPTAAAVSQNRMDGADAGTTSSRRGGPSKRQKRA